MSADQIQSDRPSQPPTEGWLFFAIESLIIVAGYVSVLRSETLSLGPARGVLLALLVLAHLAFLWLSPYVLHSRRQLLIYLAVQTASALGVSLLTPGHWLAIGVYMGVLGLAVAALWPDWRAIVPIVLVLSGLSIYHQASAWGWSTLMGFLPTLGLVLAFVIVYVVLYTRQMQARERAQALLEELEVAHRQLQEYAGQVQALTISQERQRMAQELHDTLAQGVAGLILQLEAADSHLERDDAPRAQETVQRAMVLARATLREARRAIQDLRPVELEREGLIDALGREVDEFAETTGVRATFQVDAPALQVPADLAPDVLRIAQESLSNAARHAHAAHVAVRLAARDGRLRLTIQDDGIGFDADGAADRPGRYGLRGMRERADEIGAELRVQSAPGKGTTITLDLEVGL